MDESKGLLEPMPLLVSVIELSLGVVCDFKLESLKKLFVLIYSV